LLAVVVEVDLLAGHDLDDGPLLVLLLDELPDVRLAVLVEVEGDDLLAAGVAQRRVDLGDLEIVGAVGAGDAGGGRARLLLAAAACGQGDEENARPYEAHGLSVARGSLPGAAVAVFQADDVVELGGRDLDDVAVLDGGHPVAQPRRDVERLARLELDAARG